MYAALRRLHRVALNFIAGLEPHTCIVYGQDLHKMGPDGSTVPAVLQRHCCSGLWGQRKAWEEAEVQVLACAIYLKASGMLPAAAWHALCFIKYARRASMLVPWMLITTNCIPCTSLYVSGSIRIK